MDRLIELINLFLDDEASPEELRELAQRVLAKPEDYNELWNACRLHAAMLSAECPRALAEFRLRIEQFRKRLTHEIAATNRKKARKAQVQIAARCLLVIAVGAIGISLQNNWREAAKPQFATASAELLRLDTSATRDPSIPLSVTLSLIGISPSEMSRGERARGPQPPLFATIEEADAYLMAQEATSTETPGSSGLKPTDWDTYRSLRPKEFKTQHHKPAAFTVLAAER